MVTLSPRSASSRPSEAAAMPLPSELRPPHQRFTHVGRDAHMLMIDDVTRAIAIERNRSAGEVERSGIRIHHDLYPAGIAGERRVERARGSPQRIPSLQTGQRSLDRGGRDERFVALNVEDAVERAKRRLGNNFGNSFGA